VELAVTLTADRGPGLGHGLALAFFALALVFVWRSFYGMRIGSSPRTPVHRDRRPVSEVVRER